MKLAEYHIQNETYAEKSKGKLCISVFQKEDNNEEEESRVIKMEVNHEMRIFRTEC